MALVHRATLHPTKLELMAPWLPTRPWYRGTAGAGLVRVAACRFDDPAGQVGVETILVRSGDGPVHHVPLTYRGAPLEGGEKWLIGTTEHSVLGHRWVYDACGDPVYASALAAAILTGTGEAEEILDDHGDRRPRRPDMSVRGSGAPGVEVPAVGTVARVVDADPTLIGTDALELAVVRTIDDPTADHTARTNDGIAAGGAAGPVGATLTGTWTGVTTPVLLAYARPR